MYTNINYYYQEHIKSLLGEFLVGSCKVNPVFSTKSKHFSTSHIQYCKENDKQKVGICNWHF